MTKRSRCSRQAPTLIARRWTIWVLAALLAGAGALGWALVKRQPAAGEPIGLFTSLPILWGEAPDIATELSGTSVPHWARSEIAAAGEVVPLDVLGSPGGEGPLARLSRLIVAQPRPLSPQENVALDTWVRGGGQLLLFADPALTEESAFAIGDPRRPQTGVLLSPILTRWGLSLRFDDAQPFGERSRQLLGVAVPVNLPGLFVPIDQSGCRILADGLAAQCRVGKGRVLAVADAAVLEREDSSGLRPAAIRALIADAFVAERP